MAKVYHSIPLDEERLEDNGGKAARTLRYERSFLSRTLDGVAKHWAWLGHAVLLSISMSLFTLSFCARDAKPSDLTYTQRYSSYSPVAPTVKYESVRYNLTPIVEGPFVGYGPEVDRAWDYIANDVGDQMISAEELDRLGLPRNSLKITDPKTGKEGYRAAVEVFHQLHCLNLIRQAVYKEYYSKDEWNDVGGADSKEDLSGHVDHCIETLRMNLMCQSDIGIFSFRLYPEYGYADDDYWPDFSTLHTCRNFEDIRTWARENTVSWSHDV